MDDFEPLLQEIVREVLSINPLQSKRNVLS